MLWIGWYLRELVFPSACACCGAEGGEIICARCLREMPLLAHPLCSRCATPTLYPVDECRGCRKSRLAFDRAVALGRYDGPMREAVLELKYRNGRRLAPLLGAMLSVRVESELGMRAAGAVTFVPLHRRRERERGYNQARLLAKEVSRHLGLPLLPLLERRRETAPQAGLGFAERRANVEGCISVRRAARVPHELLLVDDVLTTGATLSACAGELKDAGAERVTACVVARDLPPHAAARRGSKAR